MESYVCTFRGRRDSYQAPLALAEGGLLDQFITDAYAVSWVRAVARLAPAAMRTKVEFRSEPGIPLDRVRCLWGTTLLEHARHRLGGAPALTWHTMDCRFSRAAARRAAQTRSHLFVYSPYGWETFTARYPHHTPRKVLFQYHPHPQVESRILAEDRARFPGYGESFSGGDVPLPERLARREQQAWCYADLILCASAFTRRSLLEAGADASKCCIIPYGIDPLESPPIDAAVGGEFWCIFVGSGGQRKGLHHLLLAWSRASLPKNSRLTIVCRAIDQGIDRLAWRTPRVNVVGGLSRAELAAAYARSSLFVMPSLAEGFGQVYLEALAHGCPVLGTAHSALPELGSEKEGIFLVPPGNVDALTALLEQLSHALPAAPELRRAAHACAGRFTWTAFRARLREALRKS